MERQANGMAVLLQSPQRRSRTHFDVGGGARRSMSEDFLPSVSVGGEPWTPVPGGKCVHVCMGGCVYVSARARARQEPKPAQSDFDVILACVLVEGLIRDVSANTHTRASLSRPEGSPPRPYSP